MGPAYLTGAAAFWALALGALGAAYEFPFPLDLAGAPYELAGAAEAYESPPP
jgi:hypothetical protein